MGPELVFGLVAYAGVMFVAFWAATRKSANAPLDPPPKLPPETHEPYSIGDQVLARAAEKYGLRHHIDVAAGRYDGLRIEIAAEPHGASELPELRFRCTARFERALGLDLSVKPRGVLAKLGGHEAVVSAGFDEAFAVDALHLDQAQKLLEGRLERRFLSMRSASPKLDDESLTILVQAERDIEQTMEAVGWLVKTAALVVTKRAELPRPELEEHMLRAFRELAESDGGRIVHDQLELELPEGELRVLVEHHQGKQWVTRVFLAFPRPLGCILELALEAERPALARWRRKDLKVGDSAFDSVFVVGGEPEDEVKQLLDAGARAALLELEDAVTWLSVDSKGLELFIDHAVTEADELRALVNTVRRVSSALCPTATQGAYR